MKPQAAQLLQYYRLYSLLIIQAIFSAKILFTGVQKDKQIYEHTLQGNQVCTHSQPDHEVGYGHAFGLKIQCPRQ